MSDERADARRLGPISRLRFCVAVPSSPFLCLFVFFVAIPFRPVFSLSSRPLGVPQSFSGR